MALKYLFLLAQVIAVYCDSQQCKLTDSKCLKAVAQAVAPKLIEGIPEMGIESLDPMYLELISIDLAGLKMDIRNATTTGMKKAVVDKVSVDPAKKLIKVKFHADLALEGKYKASGQLLVLPINGEGDTYMTLSNGQVQLDMTYDIVKNEAGEDRIELKTYKFVYDVKDGATYRLENLFNGNKELSNTLHNFMNTSWKLITQEFGGPMFEQPMKKIFNNIKIYLKSQPFSL